MGLLDSIDPQILALLQGPSQSDADAIRRHQLLTAGLAMMQHSNMKPIQAIGYGGQVGLQAGYDEQMRQAQERAQRLGGFSQAMALQNQLQQFQDQADLRKTEQGFADRFGGPGAPQPTQVAPPSAAPPTVPVQTALPQTAPPPGISPKDWQAAMADAANTPGATMSYTPPGARSAVQMPMPGSLSQQQMPAPATNVPPKPQKYEMYQQWGDYLSSQSHGNPLVMAQAQKYYDLAEKFRPKPVGEPKEVSVNGQRLMVQNFDSGPPQIMPYDPAQDKPERVDKGGSFGFIDPRTLKTVGADIPKTVTPGEAQNNAIQQEKLNIERVNADPLGMLGLNKQGAAAGSGAGTALGGGANGAQLLASLPQPIADQVKALAEGRMAFPAGFALKSPYWQTMISLVSQYDPSFDAVNYNARSKTRADFTSGKSAIQANALNTVIGHLGQLADAGSALNNTSIPMVNSALNFVATQTGDPRVKQFETTRKAVVDELTRVYRGTGGSEGDIKTWSDQINAANSPEQLRAVTKQIGGLLESKMEAMKQQYEKGMGTTSDGLQLLNQHARDTLDKLEGKASSAPQLTKAGASNTTATKIFNDALKAGDMDSIERLRAKGYVQ